MRDYTHTVIVPDIQYPFVHRPSEQAVMHFVKEMKPDVVTVIGDFIDFTSIASFRKKLPPEKVPRLAAEVRIGREKVAEWEKVAGKARKVFIEGNHEERLARVVEANCPELLGLAGVPGVDLSVRGLLGLESWEYLGPYGHYESGQWLGRRGGLWAYHGSFCGQNAPTQNLRRYGHSVIYGHTHRLQSKHQTDAMGRTIGAYEVGTLCDPKRTPRHSPVVDWQHGFASIWTSKKDRAFHVDLISINKGRFVVNGRRYGG